MRDVKKGFLPPSLGQGEVIMFLIIGSEYGKKCVVPFRPLLFCVVENKRKTRDSLNAYVGWILEAVFRAFWCQALCGLDL